MATRPELERDSPFSTISGEPIDPLYTEADLPADPEAAIGLPGEFPFTRGVYGSMYRGRLWTMRQFAGFGTAQETNKRFRYLLDHGQTGLSTAFDMPSLMGHDSDHPRSLGEVGRAGGASAERHLERPPGGHDPDGHPEGVHRAEGVVLPGRPGDAARDGHDRVV